MEVNLIEEMLQNWQVQIELKRYPAKAIRE
jgi:hypothetical protein